MNSLSIGIDIGGTFTDFVIYDSKINYIKSFKLLSTPEDPSQAVLDGLASILEDSRRNQQNPMVEILSVIHGSTVATNILLERKGAICALITTKGFGDVIQIGRQNRPSLYDFFVNLPAPLIPPELRFEVTERVDHDGNILIALDPHEVDILINNIKKTEAKSIAVCLLFSFLRPEHEQYLGKKLFQAGFRVSLSSEIVPEFREYERTSTTAVNAYVTPAMDKYLSQLDLYLSEFISSQPSAPIKTSLRIMQSNGGSIFLDQARREAVRCILSGPAGGVIASEYIFHKVSKKSVNPTNLNRTNKEEIYPTNLITFDMGGTSTDVSIIVGKPSFTTDSVIGGFPINIPMLDIHTIGAGGGSIAYIDAGDVLRVGPESAGADPGPACYGRGDLPTVTDANLLLGRIPPTYFLGGKMPLDYSRAYSAMEILGKKMGLSVPKTALGIVAIANAHMERALRVISVERGHDPRGFTLLSYGGAGGLHACSLAANLGITNILIPPMASTLSAFGMLIADEIMDFSQTVMLTTDVQSDVLDRIFDSITADGSAHIHQSDMPINKVIIERSIDMRYRGQSFEITVPYNKSYINKFHCMHNQLYGYAKSEALIELVTLRVRLRIITSPPPLQRRKISDKNPDRALIDYRRIQFDDGTLDTPLFLAENLTPGNLMPGPAVIVSSDTTILVNPNCRASIDKFCNIFIEVH